MVMDEGAQFFFAACYKPERSLVIELALSQVKCSQLESLPTVRTLPNGTNISPQTRVSATCIEIIGQHLLRHDTNIVHG